MKFHWRRGRRRGGHLAAGKESLLSEGWWKSGGKVKADEPGDLTYWHMSCDLGWHVAVQA